MSVSAERKQELIKEYATKDADTGSPEVQVAILSERIRSFRSIFDGFITFFPLRGRGAPR